MKNVSAFIVLTAALGMLLFLSCKKEYSCEGCIGNNHPPVAVAGPDTVITLPTDSLLLNGSKSSDPDGKISTWLWTKVTGPASFTIVSATAAITLVSNLTEGVYQFELKVTDAGGLFSKDTVQITVNAAFNDKCGGTRPQVNAQLIPIGTLSEPRAGMVVASTGNKILFAGGHGTGSLSTRVDIFDFAANTWSTAELSSYRRGIAAVAAGNKIFFAGGENGGGDFMYTDVDVYDVATDTWSLSNMSTVGRGMTTATTGNKVFFAAGDYGIYATSTVNIYDLTSNTWSTASLSAPRNSPVAVSANNKVYFTGGAPSWTGPISNVIDIYDNATGVWSTSFLQVPRVWHAAIAVNYILYFAGGLSTELSPTNYQSTCSVETLNTNTGARTLMNLSTPRAGLHAVVKDNKILFFENDGSGTDSRVDMYDISTNTWSTLVLPVLLGKASIISVNNTIYVAGGFVNGVYNDKVWKLEF